MSGATASAALAAPEWFSKTNGVSGKLTSALEVKATTNLAVEDHAWMGGTKLACKGTMTATLEPGGVGKIKSYEVTSCENVKNCEGTWTVKAVNLPWKTELYAGGASGIKQRLVSGGSGTPGWNFTCKVLGNNQEDSCNLNTSAKLENKSSGGVELEFSAAESNKTTCRAGGSESGVLSGTVAFAHPESVEAIEAKEVTAAEWQQGGLRLIAAVGTVWKGKVKVTHLVSGSEGESVECEESGEGSVEPGAAGSITKMTMSNCARLPGTCESSHAGSLSALNLPWSTTLSVYGGAAHDLISNAAGTAGFQLGCTVLGLKINVSCTGRFSATLKNVAAGVEAALAAEKVTCPGFGEGATSFEGTQVIEATKGAKLEVS